MSLEEEEETPNLSACEDSNKPAVCNPRRGSSAEPSDAGTLLLGFPLPNCENNRLLFKPARLWCYTWLEQPELTETGVLVGTYCSPVFDHARWAAHFLPSASRIQLSLGTRKHLESDAQGPGLGLHLSGPPAPCTCSLSWPLTVGNTPQSPTGQWHFTHPRAQTVPQTGPGGPMGPAPCCPGDHRCPS